jgi:long-subunit acyl-CoA synthetase (AMP-forming)
VIVRPIEEHLKTSPAIEECVLACPAQTHLVAVVSPADGIVDEAEIAAQLARTNATLDPDRQVRRAIVADPRFSFENGLLTSQFKPKRKQIIDAYRKELDDDNGGIHAR